MNIDLKDYSYELPEEKIAKYPLKERDQSNLLVYNKSKISHHKFKDITELVPKTSTLVFNDTKVIPARLLFKKETGATIEIFLLQPEYPSKLVPIAMTAKSQSRWTCMIRNLKKWNTEQVLTRKLIIQSTELIITARLIDKEQNLVELNWDNENLAFVDLIEAMGIVPLPPYLKRESESEDKERYQTVYSKNEGAVAAPTSGLHFTEEILQNLQNKGVSFERLTLHVGAGTFQPIKELDVVNHPMHSEQIVLNKSTIENLKNTTNEIISVGTTSVRTLESLYWFGVKLAEEQNSEFKIEKLRPYQYEGAKLISRHESLENVLSYMERNGLNKLMGDTEIFIFPGYNFKMIDGLVTNFHQPDSTLILLIAALIGNDWKTVYQEALDNNYRFLSYGDSSFLSP